MEVIKRDHKLPVDIRIELLQHDQNEYYDKNRYSTYCCILYAVRNLDGIASYDELKFICNCVHKYCAPHCAAHLTATVIIVYSNTHIYI